MSTSKRKSFAKTIDAKVDQTLTRTDTDSPDAAQQATEDKTTETPETPDIEPKIQPETGSTTPIEFRKFTVPLRSDQLGELSKEIGGLAYLHGIEVSKASFIRLGLERVLAQLKKDPESLLKALYRLELKEMELNEDRKYSSSKGLAEYVQNAS